MELEKKIMGEYSPKPSEDTLQESEVKRLGNTAPNLPENLQGERTFTREEYSSIIEGAELLRQIDAQKGKRIEDLVERFPTEEKIVPLSRIYALAQDLDIDAKYVEKYMSLQFPSAEQQWKDLQEHNITISGRQILDIYKNEFKQALVQAFPHESFRWEGDHHQGCYRIDRRLKKSIFGRKKSVEVLKELAYFRFDQSTGYNCEVLTVYDPSFLRVVDPTLARLKETFPGWPLIIETIYPLELPSPSSSPKKSS